MVGYVLGVGFGYFVGYELAVVVVDDLGSRDIVVRARRERDRGGYDCY